MYQPDLPKRRSRSLTAPTFSSLRRVTSDHLDTVVLDEHDDHHPIPEEEEPSNSVDHDSERTLQEERESQPQASSSKLNNAEKGQLHQRVKQEPSTSSNQDPETREWAEDIVTFDSKDDPRNPQNWPTGKKHFTTALYGCTTMVSTFASSVFSPALGYVAAEYGISRELAVLGISLFVLGYVPGPICFAPVSELYGRKISVLVPLFVFICFSAATATSQNIQSIMITRFFGGLFASAPVSNVGGALADMYSPRDRATAVVFYSLAVVAGPSLGPIIGGAVSQSYLGWRWTEYLVVILGSFILLLDVLFIEETFAPVLLTTKAQQLRWKTGRYELHSRAEMNPISIKKFLHRNLLLPLRMIVMEPMVLCICLFNSVAFGVLYLCFAAFPIIYEEGRGWNTLVGSLPFLAMLLGCMTAALINYFYSVKVFAPRFDANGGKSEPEWRLPPMILGAILFPVGFFILGWTSDPTIFWFPSVVGIYFLGTSFLLIFQSGINYLIDGYTVNAASAIAANTFLRSFFAAALPLIANPMFNNLGINWACTLLGCLAIVLAFIPVVFLKYGKTLRGKSKLAAGPKQ